jgi:hypothetical protein
MLKTFKGSCHCGAVRYEADIDLAKGAGKCNCTICTQSRNWSVNIEPGAFRLISDENALSDYQFNTHQGHALFCRTCGIHSFSRGHVKEIGGDYVGIQLACLDDAEPQELIDAPVTFRDGRHDNWQNPPLETRQL